MPSPESRTPPLAAVLRRSWLPVSLLVVLGTLLGGAYGYVTPVTYVAQAQVIAGATSVSAAAVPSFAQAGQSLAETYSRVFGSDPVRQAVGKADVSASPIAGSSIILIESRAGSPQAAVDNGNAGVNALLKQVSSLLSNDKNVQQARDDLDNAYSRLAQAQTALAAAKRVSPNGSNVYTLQAQVESAQASVNAYNGILTNSLSNNVQSNGVQRLASAHITSNTRFQKIGMGAAAGLVLGALLGLALAYRRALRRSSRPPSRVPPARTSAPRAR